MKLFFLIFVICQNVHEHVPKTAAALGESEEALAMADTAAANLVRSERRAGSSSGVSEALSLPAAGLRMQGWKAVVLARPKLHDKT